MMSPAGEALWQALRAAERQVRRDAALALIAAVAAVVPLLLVVSWLLAGRAVWSAPSAGPLVMQLGAFAAMAVLGVVLGRRWLRCVDEARVAAAAEAARGLAPGALRGVLELNRGVPAGGSTALHLRAAGELARELAGAGPRELAGVLGAAVRRRRSRLLGLLGVLTAMVIALGFTAPERTRSGWGPLIDPFGTLASPPLPPLIVKPGHADVPRGGHLEVSIEAPGRDEVVLRWRADGDVPRQRTLALVDGAAATRLADIDAPLVYWAVARDGAASERFRVRPFDPLLLADLSVEVRYPAYIDREPERFRGDVPPLLLPAGSQLVIRGRGNRPLESVELVGADGEPRIPFVVEGASFAGRWSPGQSGTYDWRLRDGDGDGGDGGDSPQIEITVLPDEPPTVDIVHPGPDTVLGASLRQPLVADARDDRGLSSAALVSWRVSAGGEKEAHVEEPIALSGEPERAILRSVLDLSDRSMVPGDTVYYFVRVVDNSPGAQTGVSQTQRLTLPGLSELRERAREEARSAAQETGELRESARRLEGDTRDLTRQATGWPTRGSGDDPRPSSGSGRTAGGGEDRSVPSRDLERARQALERQEALLERVQQMRERTDRLQQAMEEAGLRDPEMQRRLQELRDLYDEVLSDEQKQRISEARSALDERDPERVRRALESMARDQRSMRERLDRSAEILRRAALEQRMNELAQEARELSREQQALAETMKEDPSPEQAAQQDSLAARAERLEEALDQLSADLEREGESEAAQSAADARDQVRDARESMERAADDARGEQPGEAGESAGAAASQLESASDELDSARSEMAQGWREEARDAVEQATSDALAIAERQQELLERMRDGENGDGEEGGDRRQAGSSPPDLMPRLPQPKLPLPQKGDASGSGKDQDADGNAGQQSRDGGSQDGQQGEGQQGQGQQGQGGQQQGGQQGSDKPGGDQSGGAGGGGDGAGQEAGGSQPGGESRGEGGELSGAQPGQQGSGGHGGGEQDALRSEQIALQRGLETLARNLEEVGQKSALIDPEVGAALERALSSMRETSEALAGRDRVRGRPTDEAERAVEALNLLALALIDNAQQIAEAESGTGLQEALDRLAELAQDQRSVSSEAKTLMSAELSPEIVAERLRRLSGEQREISTRLEGMNDMVGGPEGVWGELDALSREAEILARELSGGRVTPELLSRQERMFHRLLDAGRILERDEVREERRGERPGEYDPTMAGPLDAELLDGRLRYSVPGPEELRALPAAYRRMVLDYFDRLNRAQAGQHESRRP